MEENHLTLATPTKKDCNLAVIMDVAMFFVFIIAPFVIYLTKPDRPFLKDQACENLNMNITLILWSIVSFVLTFVLIGVIGYVILSIYFLVTVILAAVANSKGEIYRYPFILRLIK